MPVFILVDCFFSECYNHMIGCLCVLDNYRENSFQTQSAAVKLAHRLIKPHTKTFLRNQVK